jgi:hypothetical protein
VLSVSSRSANCDAKLLLYIALGIELLQICPQILCLLFVLDTGKYHFGARDFCLRILDIFLESLFARFLIGIGIAIIQRTSGVTAIEAIEFGSDTVRCARPDFVTRRALEPRLIWWRSGKRLPAL